MFLLSVNGTRTENWNEAAPIRALFLEGAKKNVGKMGQARCFVLSIGEDTENSLGNEPPVQLSGMAVLAPFTGHVPCGAHSRPTNDLHTRDLSTYFVKTPDATLHVLTFP